MYSVIPLEESFILQISVHSRFFTEFQMRIEYLPESNRVCCS